MNEFVEECRREWTRLGVPDAIADEMAAELAADLDEAAAEGASAEDVLGSSALDPRSFAAAWAFERVVGGAVPANGRASRRRYVAAAAIAALACVAIAGGVLVTSAPGTARVAQTGRLLPDDPGRAVLVLPARPPLGEVSFTVDGRSNPAVWVVAPTLSPDATMIAVPGRGIEPVDVEDSGVRTVGWVLLTVGLAGLAPLAILWLWTGGQGARRSRRQASPSRT